jgi:hypothetical protein
MNERNVYPNYFAVRNKIHDEALLRGREVHEDFTTKGARMSWEYAVKEARRHGFFLGICCASAAWLCVLAGAILFLRGHAP